MKARISLVLQVADIAVERAFYRDIVGLGEPVMNSNVWVEFKLDGGTSFCLEQAAPNKPPLPPHGRTEFLFFVDSLGEFEKRYRAQNADAPEGIPCGQLGIHAMQYPDPEGNLFRVTDKQHC
ncbi:MAG: VOC family protein [Lentisphaeria bacterium]|nr:VOC family protein [Lentisphaeria bacterium]